MQRGDAQLCVPGLTWAPKAALCVVLTQQQVVLGTALTEHGKQRLLVSLLASSFWLAFEKLEGEQCVKSI